MKMVKSLVLGLAAGMVAIAGAQAADVSVKAKPVQYAHVGGHYSYIPMITFGQLGVGACTIVQPARVAKHWIFSPAQVAKYTIAPNRKYEIGPNVARLEGSGGIEGWNVGDGGATLIDPTPS